MEEDVGRQTVRGMGRGERERDGGGYPRLVHVQVSASSADTRGELPSAQQFCYRAVPLVDARSLCLLPLTFAQEAAAACLPCQTETRPRSIERASEAENKKPQTTSYFLLVKQ